MFEWIYTIIVIESVLSVGLTTFILVLLRKASPSFSNLRMYSVIQLIAATCKTLSYAMNWVVDKKMMIMVVGYCQVIYFLVTLCVLYKV